MSTATKYQPTITQGKGQKSAASVKAAKRWPWLVIAVIFVLMVLFIRLVSSIPADSNAEQIKSLQPTSIATSTPDIVPTASVMAEKAPEHKDVNAPIANEELAQPGDDSAYLKDDTEEEKEAPAQAATP